MLVLLLTLAAFREVLTLLVNLNHRKTEDPLEGAGYQGRRMAIMTSITASVHSLRMNLSGEWEGCRFVELSV
jgi:hypothetical protein